MGGYIGVEPTWAAQTNAGRTHIATKGIVQSGLVLNLDAGVSSSYPGSGTTWTDLSGNGNTGTLVNGVGYSGTNGGALSFDGVNDYGTTSFINHNIATGDFSYGVWFYATALRGVGATLCAFMGNGDYTPTFGFDLSGFSNQLGFYWSGWKGFGSSPSLNTWNYAVMTRTSGVIRGYLNATICPTTYNVNFSMSNAQNVIGRSGVTYAPDVFTGNISQVSIYNKALTATEVQQNYNATKSRYI